MTLDEVRGMQTAVLTMADVASLLNVDTRTVRRACEDGQIPSIHVGRRVLIPRDRLLALLSAPATGDVA
jgi:excisionase family DNA binding protein